MPVVMGDALLVVTLVPIVFFLMVAGTSVAWYSVRGRTHANRGGEGDGQGGDELDHAGDDGGQGPPAGGGTINGTQPELPSAPQANVTGDGGADGEQAVDGDGAAANGTGQDAQGAPGPIPGPERR